MDRLSAGRRRQDCWSVAASGDEEGGGEKEGSVDG